MLVTVLNAGTHKGVILCHQVWVKFAFSSVLVTSQVDVSTKMNYGLISNICSSPLGMLVKRRKRQIFKRLVMANHTHTRWHIITPLT